MTSFCEPRPVAKANGTRTQTAIYGSPISHSVAPSVFNIIFGDLGLPRYKYSIQDCPSLDDPEATWTVDMRKPTTLGSCVTMPLKIAVMSHMDEITPQAKAIGSVNTTYFRENGDGSSTHVGTNLDTAGVHNSLFNVLSGEDSPYPADAPSKFADGTAAAIMIGGGGATRAAIYAMVKMNLSPILLLNRDSNEIEATVKQFPHVDIRPVTSPTQAREILSELDTKGTRLTVGVGAIPSIEPQSAAELNVYEVAKILFTHKSAASGEQSSSHIAHPARPTFLEMAYKPRMTIMRGVAEEAGWQTICGVEVVLEGCFEQAYLWTGCVVERETRDKARKLLRAD